MDQKSTIKKYSGRVHLDNPWLPEAWPEWETEPSPVFTRINRTAYPPLFADKSWTKGVPEKDVDMYLRPSETIGSCFTPQAQELRIQDLYRKRKKSRIVSLTSDGRLRYPPKKTRKELEEQERKEEVKRKVKKEESLFVNIEDLLSGEYWRQRKEKEEKMKKERKMKNKIDLLQWEGFPDESE